MNALKTIIIDDSKAIRTELKFLLDEFPQILFAGEASNIQQAVQLVEKIKPDLIFLDIQLKSESGFDLLEKTDVSAKIIFVTAYNQYAIRAFDVNALDYLLKPIQIDRLRQAIERIPHAEQTGDTATENDKVEYDDIVYLMINRSLKFIKVSNLKAIIAEGKYTFILHGENKQDLVSKTLLEWENILPEKYFIRIHRSTIVNFEYVERVKKCPNNTHEVYIKNIEKPFIMSRRYAAKLKSVLSI